MSIGQNIKKRRRELDLTLEEVAKQVGLSRQTLSRYETGVIGNIPSDTIEALATILCTTPAYLMGWEDNSPFSQSADAELTEYLELLKNRPECRMLFSLTKDATKEEVEKAVAIIEALRKTEGK